MNLDPGLSNDEAAGETAAGEPSVAIDRFPGPRSFEAKDAPVFFGRTKEADELFFTVLRSRLTVVTGHSGIGKSSLINAALLPRLQDHGCAIIRSRVGKIPSKAFADSSQEALDILVGRASAELANVGLDVTEGDRGSLWDFLKTSHIWRGADLLQPVLVLDQFEEIFTAQTYMIREAIVDQLSSVVRMLPPEKKGKPSDNDKRNSRRNRNAAALRTAPEVRIVIVIRDDFVGQLRQFSDRIPGIFQDFFLIQPLTYEQGRAAVVQPSECRQMGLCFRSPRLSWSESELDVLLRFVSLDAAHQGDSIGEMTDQWRARAKVDPFPLQIVCRHVEEAMTALEETTPGIEERRVPEGYLNGSEGLSAIVQDYYLESLAKLSAPRAAKRVQHLFAEGLVTEGRRSLLREDEIVETYDVSKRTLQELCEFRLIRSELIRGSPHYELSHDRLIEPVMKQRPKGLTEKGLRRLRLRAAVAIAVLLFIVAIVTVLSNIEIRLANQQRDLAIADLGKTNQHLDMVNENLAKSNQAYKEINEELSKVTLDLDRKWQKVSQELILLQEEHADLKTSSELENGSLKLLLQNESEASAKLRAQMSDYDAAKRQVEALKKQLAANNPAPPAEPTKEQVYVSLKNEFMDSRVELRNKLARNDGLPIEPVVLEEVYRLFHLAGHQLMNPSSVAKTASERVFWARCATDLMLVINEELRGGGKPDTAEQQCRETLELVKGMLPLVGGNGLEKPRAELCLNRLEWEHLLCRWQMISVPEEFSALLAEVDSFLADRLPLTITEPFERQMAWIAASLALSRELMREPAHLPVAIKLAQEALSSGDDNDFGEFLSWSPKKSDWVLLRQEAWVSALRSGAPYPPSIRPSQKEAESGFRQIFAELPPENDISEAAVVARANYHRLLGMAEFRLADDPLGWNTELADAGRNELRHAGQEFSVLDSADISSRGRFLRAKILFWQGLVVLPEQQAEKEASFAGAKKEIETLKAARVIPPIEAGTWRSMVQERLNLFTGSIEDMEFVALSGTRIFLARFEMRYRDFKLFLSETGWKPTKTRYWGRTVNGSLDYEEGEISWDALCRRYELAESAPVLGVSFKDIEAFCKWLTEKDRTSRVIPETGLYRLPSDSEWSLAALNSQGDKYPPNLGGPSEGPPSGNFGDKALRGWGKLGKVEYPINGSYDDGIEKIAPVRSFPPNSLGFFDLEGNVREFVTGDSTGEPMLRGGSWIDADKESLRLDVPHKNTLGGASVYILEHEKAWPFAGFRLVYDPGNTTEP